MALVVNSNIASLNAQRNLTQSNNAMSVSLQRLSSGLRVNSAKDDAAALAISQGMTSQIRGSNQAVRNANDGVSLGQTLEGALGQLANMGQRIREIAVQAANASVSSENRVQLQKEVDQLTQEMSRVVQTTEFNGTYLLNQSTDLRFQVGYDGQSSNEVAVSLTNMAGSSTVTFLNGATTTTNYSTAATKLSSVSAFTSAGTVDVINTTSASVIKATDLNTYASGTAGFKVTSGDGTDYYLQFVGDFTVAAATAGDAAKVINGGTVLVKDEQGNLKGTVTGISAIAGGATLSAGYLEFKGSTASANLTSAALNTYNASLGRALQVDITDQDKAKIAVEKLDADLKSLNTQRAVFGAVQNRFEAVVSNLSNYAENLSQSRSRMIDADFAEETANMTKNQVLQQAGVAILAQANSLPQAAMSLLR